MDERVAGWVAIMLLTSSRVKHSVMIIKKPTVPFTATPAVMVRGRVSEAYCVLVSLVSTVPCVHLKTGGTGHLHMWTAQLKPPKDTSILDRPTMTAVPVELQPPALLN